MPTRLCIERNSKAAVRFIFMKPLGLAQPISFPRSLSDIAPSTAANDPRPSASCSARKNPQCIPPNTPPVFPGLRPHSWPHLLRLVTKALSDRLLALTRSSGILSRSTLLDHTYNGRFVGEREKGNSPVR